MNLIYSFYKATFFFFQVKTFGPTTQRHFLTVMGIDARKQVKH
jgi:hypothetical protein